MKNQDWKLKYQDLKIKFMDAVDVSFRLGFEQGAQDAQNKQAQQQQADAQAMQQAQMGGQPGQDPNAPPGQEGEMPPGQEPSDGSEMDQHIAQLESMVNKSEAGSMEQISLKKSLDGLKAFQNSLRSASDLRKSERLIKSIGQAMKSKPIFTMGKAATKNMSEPAKKALNMQEQIVEDLMKSFIEEEAKAASAITKTLDFEQILKG